MQGLIKLLSIATISLPPLLSHRADDLSVPHRELRGAWIATVHALDWPKSRDGARQQQDLRDLIASLHEAGINAVFFQVRAEGDAFYASETEPWSRWLTGRQGAPPEPYFDPLQVVLDEAHSRGMEVHAWFNPYRLAINPRNQMHQQHIAQRRPEWTLRVGEAWILDPGLPEVRDYVTDVVMEVVRKYDIDGVHFDDYFYPYPPNSIARQDDRSYAAHGRGTNRAEWRRTNVNQLIQQVAENIAAIEPEIHFGISPFGIWRNGTPAGISGLSAYDELYADATEWLNSESVDYVAPQLYWRIGGAQDYVRLLDWWAENANGRHVFAGQALHNLEGRANWDSGEILQQIQTNRMRGVGGAIFFRAGHVAGNSKGIKGHFSDGVFSRPALPPEAAWKESVPPNPPQHARSDGAGGGSIRISWEAPVVPEGARPPRFFAVYRIDPAAVVDVTVLDARSAELIGVTGERSFVDQNPASGHIYLITSVSRSRLESSPAVAE